MTCQNVTEIHRFARNVIDFYPVDLTGATDFYVTIKAQLSDIDSASVIQVSNSGGLLVLAGAPAVDASWGSATYSGLTVTLILKDDAMAVVPASTENLYIDIKGFDALGARVPAYEGLVFIAESATRAI